MIPLSDLALKRARQYLHCAVRHAKHASLWTRHRVASAIRKLRQLAASLRRGLRIFPTYEERNQDWITAADLHLAVLDPDAERDSLRQRVPFSAKTLARKAHKYLTLAAEYTQRETERKRRSDELKQSYTERLATACPAKPTHQSPCHPFESGRNVLPGMEAFRGIA